MEKLNQSRSSGPDPLFSDPLHFRVESNDEFSANRAQKTNPNRIKTPIHIPIDINGGIPNMPGISMVVLQKIKKHIKTNPVRIVTILSRIFRIMNSWSVFFECNLGYIFCS